MTATMYKQGSPDLVVGTAKTCDNEGVKVRPAGAVCSKRCKAGNCNANLSSLVPAILKVGNSTSTVKVPSGCYHHGVKLKETEAEKVE